MNNTTLNRRQSYLLQTLNPTLTTFILKPYNNSLILPPPPLSSSKKLWNSLTATIPVFSQTNELTQPNIIQFSHSYRYNKVPNWFWAAQYRFRFYYPSFFQSFNPPILQSFNPSILHSFNPSINQSINPSINPSILQSLDPSTLQSFIPSFFNPSFGLSVFVCIGFGFPINSWRWWSICRLSTRAVGRKAYRGYCIRLPRHSLMILNRKYTLCFSCVSVANQVSVILLVTFLSLVVINSSQHLTLFC